MPRAPSFLAVFLVVATLVVGCHGGGPVCRELEGAVCLQCAGEWTRCAFDGVEVTEQSCEGCEARFALLEELCASGSEATAEEVEAGMVCETVEAPASEVP